MQLEKSDGLESAEIGSKHTGTSQRLEINNFLKNNSLTVVAGYESMPSA